MEEHPIFLHDVCTVVLTATYVFTMTTTSDESLVSFEGGTLSREKSEWTTVLTMTPLVWELFGTTVIWVHTETLGWEAEFDFISISKFPFPSRYGLIIKWVGTLVNCFQLCDFFHSISSTSLWFTSEELDDESVEDGSVWSVVWLPSVMRLFPLH